MFGRFAIAESTLRVVHFIAQMMHESGALTREYENLNYSAQRLAQVWPCRFAPHGPLDPEAYANNPRKLANEVYGGRMGNTAPDDGYDYRGRGLLQLTGKGNYAAATCRVRCSLPGAPDFVREPDAVLAPAWCLAVAAAEWASRGCNELADANDLERITRRVNGGTTGLPERREWLRKTRLAWP
ncbi:glycoside hydrolase family 19 protein [Massilia cavernae]|uniref:Glycoside hydrolase family 19 protein n=1 Tax=Massilia cavernae TaxID=2320864 RepID=A0A418XH90_9BURK|nr:glycoside hydrolase family 19 protein [Massilia cavernae]